MPTASQYARLRGTLVSSLSYLRWVFDGQSVSVGYPSISGKRLDNASIFEESAYPLSAASIAPDREIPRILDTGVPETS
jgi:hypothetical protein